MPHYTATLGYRNYRFNGLAELLAKATPLRSGDQLAGIAAENMQERVAAQLALADLPLKTFLSDLVIPYETDEVSRLIIDSHDAAAFAEISHLTVGDFRNWLLRYETDSQLLTKVAAGITPEMAAAVSKIMRVQDLILVASKCEVISRFRNTIGGKGRMSTCLQPNHPTDDPAGVAASVLDGLLYGNGDAVIGNQPCDG